jgi:hypothetical protein
MQITSDGECQPAMDSLLDAVVPEADGGCIALLIDQQAILKGRNKILVQGSGAPGAGGPKDVQIHLTPQTRHDLQQVA